LSVSYSHLEPNRGPDALVIAGALLLLGCCAGAVLLRRRHPPAAVGLAIFPLALLPVSHLSPFSVLMAERFLYLSLVGASVAIAWMLGTAPLRPAIRNTLVAVLVLGFAFRAADRNRDWKHPLRLAEATVELTPDNAFAQYFLGNEAFGVGDVELAVKSFKRALELDPRQTGWRISLAHGFHLLERHDEELQVLLQGDQGAKTPPDLRERTNMALREQELLKRHNPPR
jgi:tetratricopeptide (TPR) repeat protein